MEIDLMLADGAHAVSGKLYILGGGWTTIQVPTVPHEQSIALAVGLHVSWTETNERHTFRFELKSIDGPLVQTLAEGQFEAGRPPGLQPGNEQTLLMGVNCVVKVETEGEYIITANVDGNDVKSVPFRVVRQGAVPIG